MRLIDEEEIEAQKLKTQKTKRIILTSIILLVLLCGVIVALIMYRMANPTKITTYIDGKVMANFDQILDFSTDENGKTQIYIPIRDFATCLNKANSEFGYQTYKGDYNTKRGEDDQCYVYRDGYEVAMFTKKSKKIYKLNLQEKSDEMEECSTDKDVFENNGNLYASVDGIEKGYNVYFNYDERKKVITIYTLDYLVNKHKAALLDKKIGNYGELEITDSYSNCKAIFDGLIIVKTESGKYGIIKTDDYTTFVLEPQYEDITFLTDSKTFRVTSDKKVGLFTEDGKRKIELAYDNISSMGQDSKLYVVKSNNMYGVVDEDGNIIIYPEYDQVGIDVSKFSDNGVKNGYILMDELIPVLKGEKWGFFNKKGKKVSNGFKYTEIGCSDVPNTNNVYPLLQIKDYNVIIVSGEDGKFGVMDITGNDQILNFLFDEIYIKVSEGNNDYYMTFNGKEYEVSKYLDQYVDAKNGTNKTTKTTTNTTSETRQTNTTSESRQSQSQENKQTSQTTYNKQTKTTEDKQTTSQSTKQGQSEGTEKQENEQEKQN